MAKSPKDEYAVGYGKPPEATRFKKGESGNPKGRPRGKRNVMTIFADAMFAKIQVVEGGRRVKKTKWEVMCTQLMNKAANADMKAIQIVAGRYLPYVMHQPQSKNSPDLEADREMAKKIAKHIRGLIENLDKDSNDE